MTTSSAEAMVSQLRRQVQTLPRAEQLRALSMLKLLVLELEPVKLLDVCLVPELLHSVWPRARLLEARSLCKQLRDSITVTEEVELVFEERWFRPEEELNWATMAYYDLRRCEIAGQRAKMVINGGWDPVLEGHGFGCVVFAHYLLHHRGTADSELSPPLANEEITADDLERISEVLAPCTILQPLALAENRTVSEAVGRLAQSLYLCSQLTKLDLGSNLIQSWGAEILSEILRGCSSLMRIDLSFCDICDEGIESIADSFDCVPYLTHLDLRGNSIQSDGATALGAGLTSCQMIRHLDLGSGNRIGNSGLKALLPGVTECSMTHLSLDHNGISNDDEGCMALIDALRGHPSLTHLNLRANLTGLNAGGQLADGLHCLTLLKYLDLGENCSGLDLQAERMLGYMLKNCLRLTHLNLRYSFLGCEGIRSLVYVLNQCECLQALNIGSNKIGSSREGPFEVANVMRSCKALKILQVDSQLGGMTDDQIFTLGEALPYCRSLTLLDIACNQVRRELVIDHLTHLAALDPWDGHGPRAEPVEISI